MGIKKYTPYTPSRRNMTGLDFTEITKNAPEKSLTVSLKKNSGRNNQGKITVRHHGGGSRRKYRIIDFKRNKDNIPATVLSIEYDPNRTANIALICYADGQKAYILAPQGLKVGQKIMNGEHAEARLGNCLPLSLIPIGTEVHNVELYPGAGVSKIDIERASDRVKIIIFTAKPGIVIGKGGAEIEKLKGELAPYVNGKKVFVDIKEVKRPDKEAVLVAENIAAQLENRVSFRRAMKSVMSRAMKSGALGIKTTCSGRLGGADMARTETYSDGTIPLQTLRADIDYGFAEANTTYGKVGVKVWIYKGEVLPTKSNKEGSDK